MTQSMIGSTEDIHFLQPHRVDHAWHPIRLVDTLAMFYEVT